MNKQDLIKKYEEEFETIYGFPVIRLSLILEDLKQLDEPQKPVVPQFVADWIEKNRGSLFGLNYDSVSSEIYDWVYEEEEEEGNLKKLHLACAIGYTVEKEKRYLVKIRGFVECGDYFNYFVEAGHWAFSGPSNHPNVRTYHTRKELEEAGLEEVFNSPLFEVEEVAE